MNSRKIEDLHPYLAKRYLEAKAIWQREHPSAPQPFLTQTFRSIDYQNDLYELGRSNPGKIVTNARGGQSLHNYYPSLAFDIAFHIAGEVFWEDQWFAEFADIIKPMGVHWGGDQVRFKDNPHFDVPNFTWHDAAAGKDFEG